VFKTQSCLLLITNLGGPFVLNITMRLLRSRSGAWVAQSGGGLKSGGAVGWYWAGVPRGFGRRAEFAGDVEVSGQNS